IAVVIIVFYIGIITLEGYVVVPVVMGRSMEMNATTVMLACLFWELVWGLPGLFLAMPLMAAIKAICYHVPGWRPSPNLMGTEEVDDLLEDDTKSFAAPTLPLDEADRNLRTDIQKDLAASSAHGEAREETATLREPVDEV